MAHLKAEKRVPWKNEQTFDDDDGGFCQQLSAGSFERVKMYMKTFKIDDSIIQTINSNIVSVKIVDELIIAEVFCAICHKMIQVSNANWMENEYFTRVAKDQNIGFFRTLENTWKMFTNWILVWLQMNHLMKWTKIMDLKMTHCLLMQLLFHWIVLWKRMKKIHPVLHLNVILRTTTTTTMTNSHWLTTFQLSTLLMIAKRLCTQQNLNDSNLIYDQITSQIRKTVEAT